MDRASSSRERRLGAARAALYAGAVIAALVGAAGARPAARDSVTLQMVAIANRPAWVGRSDPELRARVSERQGRDHLRGDGSAAQSARDDRARRRERAGRDQHGTRMQPADQHLRAREGRRSRADDRQAVDEAVAPDHHVADEVPPDVVRVRADRRSYRHVHERRPVQEARPAGPADVLPAARALQASSRPRHGRDRDERRGTTGRLLPAHRARGADGVCDRQALDRRAEGGQAHLRREQRVAAGIAGIRDARTTPAASSPA